MRVKVNISIFLAIVSFVALFCGIRLVKMQEKGEMAWKPQEMYNTVAGSTTYSGVSYSASESSDVLVPLGTARMRSRASRSSYRTYAPSSYQQTPMLGSSSSFSASPITYTSSSANYTSFGGGSSVGAGATGAASVSPSVMSGAASVSMPLLATSQLPTLNTNSQYQGDEAASNPIIAAAPYYGNSVNASFVSSVNPYSVFASSTYANKGISSGGNTISVTSRKNALTFNDPWWNWFNSWVSTYGEDYATDEGYTFDRYTLNDAYEDFLATYWNAGMGVPPSYEEWLDWYQQAIIDGEGSHKWGNNTYLWQPVGSVMPLIAMALVYIILVALRRRRMAKI